MRFVDVARKIIAALEVAGGLIGYGFFEAYVWPRFGDVFTAPSLVALAFFSLCVTAGIELWRGQVRGIWLSFLAQVPQLFAFGTRVSGYRLQAGWLLLVTIRPDRMYFWTGLQASTLIGPTESDPLFITLNLVPLITIPVLVRLWLRRSPAARPGTPAEAH